MRRTAAILFSLASALIPAAMPAAVLARPHRAVDDPFPATPAGRCAKEFIAMINDPTPDRVRTFESAWGSKTRLERASMNDRVDRTKNLHEQWGDIKVTDVSKTPELIVSCSSPNATLDMTFRMSAAEPGKLDSVEIAATTEEAPSHDLTAEIRTSTVEGAAKQLRDNYVYPDVGAKMADSILAKLKAGEYDDINDTRAFAQRLTDDCRAISKDRHLGIRPVAKDAPASAAPQNIDPKRDNFGFRRVEVFAGNIGYLRFDGFFGSKEAFDVASSAMNFIAGADAIIFDMRFNGGGSPEMVRQITSYLFDTKTHLNDMVDREGNVVEEYWTMDKVPGRRPRTGVPVFILTSKTTFSGAEEFTYNLQNLERATIVGETTGGGAHPVRGSRLNDHFMVRVPFMRARNPITHTNWEGTGVEPDVKTSADAALDRALELAKEASRKPQK